MTSQSDLFGGLLTDAPPLQRGHPKVAAATPSAEAVDAAQRLPVEIHLGTSSWSFPGWRGLVYADAPVSEASLAKHGLAAVAAHPLLRTVSLDRTFYAPLAESAFAAYAAEVPDQFRFVVKALQATTSVHLRDEAGNFSVSPYFLDSDYATDQLIAPCSGGLGSKLGSIVFQFPPLGKQITAAPDAFINRLYRFLLALPPGLPYAVEIRDPELLTKRFFLCLHTGNVGFCVASHARMPSPRAQLAAQSRSVPACDQRGPLVARWSLHAGLKYEDAKARYSPFDRLVDEDTDTRQALADAAILALNAGRRSFITINNKAEGCAPLSVLRLAEAINQSIAA